MKKVISILLVLAMSLGLCACDLGGTELTISNIEDYVDISCSIYPDNYYKRPINAINGTVYSDEPRSISAHCNVEGLSTNFNYKNVVITLKVFGEYTKSEILPNGFVSGSDAESVSFEKTIELRTDIAGGGSISQEIFNSTDSIVLSYSIDYKIISVSGVAKSA